MGGQIYGLGDAYEKSLAVFELPVDELLGYTVAFDVELHTEWWRFSIVCVRRRKSLNHC